MRVAWLAHHDLQNPEGGAEMTDIEMIEKAPEGVEVDVLHPAKVDESLLEYDRVVVSRLEMMPPHLAPLIAQTEPLFFSHGDVLPRTDATRHVVQRSKPFVAQSPLSLRSIEKWAGPINGIAEVPYMSLDGVREDEKANFALWAARSVWHKGLDLAREWADRKGVRLMVMTGRPRSEVLDAMAEARWFVLLSKILDGGPRAVREAQLSGCELVVNENVGYWDIEPEELRRRTLDAPRRFWMELI